MGETHFTTVPVITLEALGLIPDGVPTLPFVLVVDDEHTIADRLAETLRGEGFAAIAAYGAESALEIAKIAPPQLLVTDISMPGMNGIEMAVELKRMVPECGVLLVSSLFIRNAILEDFLEAGHHFKALAKPVDLDILVQELRNLAAQNRAVANAGSRRWEPIPRMES